MAEGEARPPTPAPPELWDQERIDQGIAFFQTGLSLGRLMLDPNMFTNDPENLDKEALEAAFTADPNRITETIEYLQRIQAARAPGEKRPAQFARELIASFRRDLREAPEPNKPIILGALGILAGINKPDDLPPGELPKKLPGEKHETLLFKLAIGLIRSQLLGPHQQNTFERKLRDYQESGIEEVLGQLDNVRDLMARVDTHYFARDVLRIILNRHTTPQTVRDDLDLLRGEVPLETLMGAHILRVGVPLKVEEADYRMLPPGTLEDWRRYFEQRPPAPVSRRQPSGYRRQVVEPARLGLAQQLYETLGPDVRVVALPLNKKKTTEAKRARPTTDDGQPEKQTAPEASTPTSAETTFSPDKFDLTSYIGIIRRRELTAYPGLIVEDAVGICALTKNMIIVWQGESGVQDGAIITTWRDVFESDKPNAYHNHVVRRVQYGPNAGALILKLLDMSHEDFMRDVARLEHRRQLARNRARQS